MAQKGSAVVALQSRDCTELSPIVEDIRGCLIVSVFVRSMHSHAVTFGTKERAEGTF